MRAALEEQVEEVGLAVHRAHHAGFGQPLGRLRQVAQPLDPAERRPRLARLRLVFLVGVGGRGRVEGGPQHAQRHPVGVDRQRRMQVQARRATAPVWFEPMAPSPCVWSRRVKFRRVPSWMHSTVSCARIRRSVRSRCGSRMWSTVTALSAGWSISR